MAVGGEVALGGEMARKGGSQMWGGKYQRTSLGGKTVNKKGREKRGKRSQPAQ